MASQRIQGLPELPARVLRPETEVGWVTGARAVAATVFRVPLPEKCVLPILQTVSADKVGVWGIPWRSSRDAVLQRLGPIWQCRAPNQLRCLMFFVGRYAVSYTFLFDEEGLKMLSIDPQQPIRDLRTLLLRWLGAPSVEFEMPSLAGPKYPEQHMVWMRDGYRVCVSQTTYKTSRAGLSYERTDPAEISIRKDLVRGILNAAAQATNPLVLPTDARPPILMNFVFFFYHWVARHPSKFVSGRPGFMDDLWGALAKEIKSSLYVNLGPTERDKAVANLQPLLNDFMTEFARYRMPSPEEERQPGTLFYELGRRVAEMAGHGREDYVVLGVAGTAATSVKSLDYLLESSRELA